MMDMKMLVMEGKYQNEQSSVNECVLMTIWKYMNQNLRKVGLPCVHHGHHHDGSYGEDCQNELFQLFF